MFGATALRRKREREQREKAARGLEPQVFPYIKPFPQKFDRNELPYFKYRLALHKVESLQVGFYLYSPTEVKPSYAPKYLYKVVRCISICLCCLKFAYVPNT